jgi:hypothetical protein
MIIISAIVLSLIHDFRNLQYLSSQITWHEIRHQNHNHLDWPRKIITDESRKFRVWSYEQMYESLLIFKTQNKSSLMKNFLMSLIMSCHWRTSSRFDQMNQVIIQSLESDRSETLTSCSQLKKNRSKST